MASRKTNQQKRQAKQAEKIDAARNHESSMKKFISLIGLDRHIRDSSLRTRLLKCHAPRVKIELDDGIAGDPLAQTLCDEMRLLLKGASIGCPTLRSAESALWPVKLAVLVVFAVHREGI